MVKENLAAPQRRWKTIGDEGSRKTTILVFLLFLTAGLILLFLSGSRRHRPSLSVKWPDLDNDEVITISKPSSARPVVRRRPDLQPLLAGQAGEFGIFIKSVNGAAELRIGENVIMTAASVIKLPLLVVYYQAVENGQVSPEAEYILAEADRWQYGTGSMQYQPAGTKYTYKQIARLVANQSDNMAAEVLIKKLGGYRQVQASFNQLGLKQTNLKENEITAAAAADLFLQLAQGRLLTPASRQELFDNLTQTVNEDRIPAGVPDNIRVVHKFGSEAGVVNDCGLVEASNPYVICVLTAGVNSGEVERLFPQISQAVWNWLGD
jgi:beta-lactamase class A